MMSQVAGTRATCSGLISMAMILYFGIERVIIYAITEEITIIVHQSSCHGEVCYE